MFFGFTAIAGQEDSESNRIDLTVLSIRYATIAFDWARNQIESDYPDIRALGSSTLCHRQGQSAAILLIA